MALSEIRAIAPAPVGVAVCSLSVFVFCLCPQLCEPAAFLHLRAVR